MNERKNSWVEAFIDAGRDAAKAQCMCLVGRYVDAATYDETVALSKWMLALAVRNGQKGKAA
jgi:hypothetical protein